MGPDDEEKGVVGKCPNERDFGIPRARTMKKFLFDINFHDALLVCFWSDLSNSLPEPSFQYRIAPNLSVAHWQPQHRVAP